MQVKLNLMKDNLDYSIIWKYFNASLTIAEEEELNNWLEADKEHRLYFDRLKKQAVNPNFDSIDTDSSKSWNNLVLSPKHKKQHFWKIGVAASILLIVAAYFSYEALKTKPEQLVSIENIQFEPGVKKATLILDSGERLKLKSEKDTLFNEADVLVQNSNSQLNYQSSNAVSQNKAKEEIKYNTLIVPRGGEYNLTLSDGTEVKVNSETILKYPVTFSEGQRNVQLIGEAFFDVKTDLLRPFIVTSGEHVVKVFGTSFNVKSYKNDSYIATTLVEGNVAVSLNIDDAEEQELKPGYQSVYQKGTNKFNQQRVNIKEFTAWKDGRFYFRNMNLNEMTEVLERWYDVEFQFKNENAKQITFNGNLKKYENLQTILNQLTKTNEITFSAYDKIIYVN
jgi:transmembrane sensor